MGCEDCQKAQREEDSYFYRIGTANIEIRGCEEHIKEAMDRLNDVHKLDGEDKELLKASLDAYADKVNPSPESLERIGSLIDKLDLEEV